jgi:3-isopropylmalate/(R)-2-methylmalate dehydratase small subunit
MKLHGRVWKLGDGIGATDLLPAAYDKAASMGKAEECGLHALEGVRPDFQANKQPGDIIVAGQNLGTGHAHYHRGAVIACRAAGVAALLGEKISGLFLRSSIDEGFPAWGIPGIHSFVNDGDQLEIDLERGEASNLTQSTQFKFPSMDKVIRDILDAGSAVQWALRRTSEAHAAD